MELFIELDFLENFEIIFDDKNRIHKIVKSIIIEYGNKNVYIDYNENDFIKLKNEFEFFALIANTTPPVSVDSIQETALNNATFKQTLVFTNEYQSWCNVVENKGAICFNFKDFETKINKIVNELHFKIDLSEEFVGWHCLQSYDLINFNNIVISDKYILTDKTQQRIQDNIEGVLNVLLSDSIDKTDVVFFTEDLNPNRPGRSEQIREKAKKRYKYLNRVFANYNVKFSIINTAEDRDFDHHDRLITTNFSILESGKGFNLLPYKRSNSQIISETIFDKYTYKRLKNIISNQEKYINKLTELETSNFKMYP